VRYRTMSDMITERMQELALSVDGYLQMLPKLSGAARTEELREALEQRLVSAREDDDRLQALRRGLVDSSPPPITRAYLSYLESILTHEGDPIVREMDLHVAVIRIESDIAALADTLCTAAETVEMEPVCRSLRSLRQHALAARESVLRALSTGVDHAAHTAGRRA
jgi:hypothetical protein